MATFDPIDHVHLIVKNYPHLLVGLNIEEKFAGCGWHKGKITSAKCGKDEKSGKNEQQFNILFEDGEKLVRGENKMVQIITRWLKTHTLAIPAETQRAILLNIQGTNKKRPESISKKSSEQPAAKRVKVEIKPETSKQESNKSSPEGTVKKQQRSTLSNEEAKSQKKPDVPLKSEPKENAEKKKWVPKGSFKAGSKTIGQQVQSPQPDSGQAHVSNPNCKWPLSIRRKVAEEVCLRKSPVSAAARKFGVSNRSAGRFVEEFRTELLTKSHEKQEAAAQGKESQKKPAGKEQAQVESERPKKKITRDDIIKKEAVEESSSERQEESGLPQRARGRSQKNAPKEEDIINPAETKPKLEQPTKEDDAGLPQRGRGHSQKNAPSDENVTKPAEEQAKLEQPTTQDDSKPNTQMLLSPENKTDIPHQSQSEKSKPRLLSRAQRRAMKAERSGLSSDVVSPIPVQQSEKKRKRSVTPKQQENTTKQSAAEPQPSVFNIGDVVKARWRNDGHWYKATVIAIQSAGRFDILFDDGVKEKSVHPNSMRLMQKKGASQQWRAKKNTMNGQRKMPKDDSVGLGLSEVSTNLLELLLEIVQERQKQFDALQLSVQSINDALALQESAAEAEQQGMFAPAEFSVIFNVRGTFQFDLDAGCEGGNQEFWYERIDTNISRITGKHQGPKYDRFRQAICFRGADILGNSYKTVTMSGKTVDWMVLAVNKEKNFMLTIGIKKPSNDQSKAAVVEHLSKKQATEKQLTPGPPKSQAPLSTTQQEEYNEHSETADIIRQFIQKQGLVLAAKDGDLATVKMEVEAGTDINMKDCNGCTALIWAARMGHLGVCRYLLQKGAKAYLTTNDGRTALQAAMKNRRTAVVELLTQGPGKQGTTPKPQPSLPSTHQATPKPQPSLSATHQRVIPGITLIRKAFNGVNYVGKVVSFEDPYYSVLYEDGDSEEMSLEQIRLFISRQNIVLGVTEVIKPFDGVSYRGKVVSFEDPYYNVVYEDGDSEEMPLAVLLEYVIPPKAGNATSNHSEIIKPPQEQGSASSGSSTETQHDCVIVSDGSDHDCNKLDAAKNIPGPIKEPLSEPQATASADFAPAQPTPLSAPEETIEELRQAIHIGAPDLPAEELKDGGDTPGQNNQAQAQENDKSEAAMHFMTENGMGHPNQEVQFVAPVLPTEELKIVEDASEPSKHTSCSDKALSTFEGELAAPSPYVGVSAGLVPTQPLIFEQSEPIFMSGFENVLEHHTMGIQSTNASQVSSFEGGMEMEAAQQDLGASGELTPAQVLYLQQTGAIFMSGLESIQGSFHYKQPQETQQLYMHAGAHQGASLYEQPQQTQQRFMDAMPHQQGASVYEHPQQTQQRFVDALPHQQGASMYEQPQQTQQFGDALSHQESSEYEQPQQVHQLCMDAVPHQEISGYEQPQETQHHFMHSVPHQGSSGYEQRQEAQQHFMNVEPHPSNYSEMASSSPAASIAQSEGISSTGSCIENMLKQFQTQVPSPVNQEMLMAFGMYTEAAEQNDRGAGYGHFQVEQEQEQVAQQFEVQIPEGVTEGNYFHVDVNGTQVSLVVPEGYGPGDLLAFILEISP